MRYCFSGHESFPCKSMWLKKGYDYLVDRNRFTDPDAVVKLGVGKNMVQSIRFWLRAFGLLNDDEATEIAHYLFDDRDGRDPYAEDNRKDPGIPRGSYCRNPDGEIFTPKGQYDRRSLYGQQQSSGI